MIDAVLRDVGTATPLDVRGATGFDPPSLLGVGLTAPYLHDGSRSTLEDLIAAGHPAPPGAATTPAGGSTGRPQLFLPWIGGRLPVRGDDLAALAAFLRSIGPGTPTIEAR